MRSVPVMSPQTGEPRTQTGARVVTCVESVVASLHDELRGAGFGVEHTGRLSDVCGLVRCDESVIVLCDTNHHDWLRALSDLVVLRPHTQLVLLASLDPAEFLAALSAGVSGFCAPDAPAVAVVRTVKSVERTGTSIPRHMVPLLVQNVRHGSGRAVHTGAGVVDVTEREWAILQLLMQRRSTREMAEALFVSVGTVRCHVSTLLKKLGAVSRDDAVSLFDRGCRSLDA